MNGRLPGPSQGRLLLVGGGMQTQAGRHRSVLAEMARNPVSGAPASSVLLVPAASMEPEYAIGTYVRAFQSMGVDQADVLDVRTRADAQRPSRASVELLRRAEVVLFTGGDQERLSGILRDTPLHAALKAAFESGAQVAGTSAGAVAMAEVMHFAPADESANNAHLVDTAPGLGLLTGVFVDTHFTERQRLGRLFALVTAEPERIGLGLDEDTAVIVTGRRAVVVGRSSVTVVDGRPLLQDRHGGVHLHLLRSGDAYDLDTGVPTFGAGAARQPERPRVTQAGRRTEQSLELIDERR